jgi:DNA modification methylase
MEINKIYNENCLDTMARMPDGFVDLSVTSPPYDNLRDYFLDKFVVWRYNISYEDKQRLIKELQEKGIKPVAPSK